MEHYELRLLADFVGNPLGFGGAPQAANTWQRPTPAAVGGELQLDERGEVVFAEIYSPVAAGLTDEDLRKVVIVLDGEDTGKYISLSGIRSNCMAPPKDRIFNGRLYSFGAPHSNDPLRSTTLKYKHDVTVNCLAGPDPAGITGTYRIRLWGYVYKVNEIPGVFGMMQFPTKIYESARNRVLNIIKNPIMVTGDTWLTLPGGKDQSIPKINPFARFANNLLATDGMQGDYQFRFTAGNVADEQENMYFEFDEKDALLIESLGVAPVNDLTPLTNLARTGLRIATDYHPKGPTTRQALYPTDVVINQLNYGLFNVAMLGMPLPIIDVFTAIPKLERPYLIWNEIGYPLIRDDGVAAIPINGAKVCITGLRIEMRS